MKIRALLATFAAAIGLGACTTGYQQPPSGAMYSQPNNDFTMYKNPNGELMWCRTRTHRGGPINGNHASADPRQGSWTEDCQNYPPNERGYDNPNRWAENEVRRAGSSVFRAATSEGIRAMRRGIRLRDDGSVTEFEISDEEIGKQVRAAIDKRLAPAMTP